MITLLSIKNESFLNQNFFPLEVSISLLQQFNFVEIWLEIKWIKTEKQIYTEKIYNL